MNIELYELNSLNDSLLKYAEIVTRVNHNELTYPEIQPKLISG